MRKIALAFLLLLSISCEKRKLPCYTKNSISTPRIEHYNEYHGILVHDPYHWLEDFSSDEVNHWVEQQNQVSDSYLNQLKNRDSIKQSISPLYHIETQSIPIKEGETYYYFYNDGYQNQPLFMSTEDLNEKGKVLLDPNVLSDDGSIVITDAKVSKDNQYVAYQMTFSGSDQKNQIRIKDIKNNKDLTDQLDDAIFSHISWSNDSLGFFYSKMQKEDNRFYHQLMFHKVGDSQDLDELVFSLDKDYLFLASQVSLDGNYLIILASFGTSRKNAIYYKDLRAKEAKVIPLFPDFDAKYEFLDNEDSIFYFAQSGDLISIDLSSMEKKLLIPKRDKVFQEAIFLKDHFIVHYLEDVRSRLSIYDKRGDFQKNIALPINGAIHKISLDKQKAKFFFDLCDFIHPKQIYRYDLLKNHLENVFSPKINWDPDQFVVKQIFYSSKDQNFKKIPMFICHKKNLSKTPSPTLLYGYGGFNVSLTPFFSPFALAWMQDNGIFCVANIRGGGEYGDYWHEAGMKLQKQNVFDDFILAATYLIDNNYTDRSRLAIMGGSNGGLLVGACMTQRSDLFAACIPRVGVLDMLRFENFTVGKAWRSDYGSVENKEEFFSLYKYSPYHNVQNSSSYPPTLILTDADDDRVVPFHSYKFAAALQYAQKNTKNPILLKVNQGSGHRTSAITKKLNEDADILAFLQFHLFK